jgi:hypothetical protein
VSNDALLKALDEAAAEILKLALAGGKNDAGEMVSLAERVKAFDAVASWYKDRHGIIPPEKKPSQFDAIRSEFLGDGKKADSRRGRPKKPKDAGETEPDADGGAEFEPASILDL